MDGILILVSAIFWGVVVYCLVTKESPKAPLNIIFQVISTIILLPVFAIAFMGLGKNMIDTDEGLKDQSKMKKLFIWAACCWSIIGFFFVLPLLTLLGIFK